MKILFVSLGCDKNLADTEAMLGLLYKKGFTFTDEEQEADVIIINTCCFIHDAKEESINTILQMAEYRTKGICKALIVTGCLAQRYQREILKEIPEVDALLGTADYEKITWAVQCVLEGKKPEETFSLEGKLSAVKERILTTGGYFAYLKIAEGCDKCCTYCIIPKIRGKYRSVEMEELVEQAQELVKKGVRELILVAQETTLYGVDLYGEKYLPRLLRRLCQIEGLVWIRILYCYPEEITQELVQVLKEEKKICHYLDIPIQHASDAVLKRMGRRTTKQELKEKIKMLREKIPDIVLRTTLISGFPGETQQDHQELMEFIDEIEFERLGVFTYSQEEDTPAADMPNQIEERVKERRRSEAMELQQDIAFDFSQGCIGREMLVLIEGKLADENAYIGRTYMDAPGVDGNIFITTDEELLSGDFVRVRVTGACEYDLIGELM